MKVMMLERASLMNESSVARDKNVYIIAFENKF